MSDISLKPSFWASVSGGKDSFYMLNCILSDLDTFPLNGVVHYELEIDFPFIKDVVDLMESRCNSFGIPFVRIRPRVSWYDLYNKFGFPTRSCRWCLNYKLDAQLQLRDFLLSRGENLISYIGYCYDEKARYSKRNNKFERYPLVELEISEPTILAWARDFPFYQDYYKICDRCGCMFCPQMSRNGLAYLLHYFPNEYSQLISMASETELRLSDPSKSFSVFDGKGKYNSAFIDYRIRNYYEPLLFPPLFSNSDFFT